MKESYDVVIVGGGPGGSAAGAALAGRGVGTLIVDKAVFPREKICGDGVSPEAVDLCRRLGLSLEKLMAGRRPERRIRLTGPSGASFTAEYPRDPCAFLDSYSADFGVVAPRAQFDKLLLDHARSMGCAVLEGATFLDLVREGKKLAGVRIRRDGLEEEIGARLVIGADGAHSRVARVLGLAGGGGRAWAASRRVEGVRCEPDLMQIHFPRSLRPGYGWIFPCGEGRANVGVYLPERALARKGASVHDCYHEFIESYEPARRQLADHRPLEKLRGEMLPLSCGRRPRAAADGCLLVGDAAALVDPLTGEGIGQAMESGLLAAEYAEHALSFEAIGADLLAGYDKKLRRRFARRTRASRFILFLVSRFGWFVNVMFGKCRDDPYVREEVFGVISGRRGMKALFGPRLWWNIYFGRFRRFAPRGSPAAGEMREMREMREKEE